MSRQSGKPYVCARKGVKLYMPDPVVVEDQSITTAGKQRADHRPQGAGQDERQAGAGRG